MAQPVLQTSFASGEWAPKLRARVDITKYHAGAALLRNFFVDYSGGGASTRQGTRFIAQCGSLGARLIPFQPSSNLSYELEFGQNYIRFYSNGAQIVTAPNVPYQIASPYNVADLFPNQATGNPGLKFVQDVTSLIICHPNYAPQILTITSATNWTLTALNFGPTIATPTNLAVTSTDGGGTTWYYSYLVTAVDVNGQESAPTAPVTFGATVEMATANITNDVSWTAVQGAMSYNVYKASPSYTTVIPAGAQYGFISNVTGVSMVDSTPGIDPDFSQTPPIPQNPFQGAGVASYTVTAPGTYTTVPTVIVGAPPSGGAQASAQAVLQVTAAVPGVSGTGFAVGSLFAPTGANSYGGLVLAAKTVDGSGRVTSFTITYPGNIYSGAVPANPVQMFNIGSTGIVFASLTWGVGAVQVISAGAGYLVAPSVAFSAGAATATSTLATASAGNPGVPGFLQERLWLAAQAKAVQTVNTSQPASFFNFNTSNPSEDDDAISASIISEELNDIRNLVPVPTGMIAFCGKGAWLLNGGGGISTMNPITPTNITAQPQGFNGANDLRPIKINFDVLYGTNKGSYIRDLSYNLYAQIFTGSDISVLSNHLFFGYNFLDWAWAEEPFKTLWCIRNDGVMISLGFVKEQELIGWAHHDTNGQFLSVCSVIESVGGSNVVDAVYVIVQRLINGVIVQNVERMADRYFPYGYEDSWSVDCALQTVPQVSPTGTLTITGDPSAIGNVVTLLDTGDAPFTATMATNNWVVRAAGGIYTITGYTSVSQVTATVKRVPTYYNTYTSPASAFPATGGYTIWQPITSVSGLTQLENTLVVGVADGMAIGPLMVSNSGVVNLPLTASKVTLGLAFLPQLQTLNLDLGEPTIQSKRKKLPAATLRVADTLGLQIGTSFANVVTMKDTQIGAIPSQSNGPSLVTDLFNGDSYTTLDQVWQEPGQLCIQQNLPYPATILGVMPQVVLGDTGRPGQ